MKHLFFASILLASLSCSNLERTLQNDKKQDQEHGQLIEHNFPNEEISEFFKRKKSNVLIFSAFAEPNDKAFIETEAFKSFLEPKSEKYVIYFHNKGEDKIYSQYFTGKEDFGVIDRTFLKLFPKPKKGDTEVLRIWKVNDTIHTIQKSQAKDIKYYNY